MPALLDGGNICTVHGNGGGAMPTRLDGNNTCTVQKYTNSVGVSVEHGVDLSRRAGSVNLVPVCLPRPPHTSLQDDPTQSITHG